MNRQYTILSFAGQTILRFFSLLRQSRIDLSLYV